MEIYAYLQAKLFSLIREPLLLTNLVCLNFRVPEFESSVVFRHLYLRTCPVLGNSLLYHLSINFQRSLRISMRLRQASKWTVQSLDKVSFLDIVSIFLADLILEFISLIPLSE